VLRGVLLTASRNRIVERLVGSAPVTRAVVARFVAGSTVEDAMRVSRALHLDGLSVTLDRLGEDTTDVGHAEAATKAYVELLDRLADEGLTPAAEVSLKLSALGQALDESLAADNAAAICDAAQRAGTTVTLDMEDHHTTDSTLHILRALRERFPGTGCVLQSYLYRTEADCQELAAPGLRVRLCKGAYREPAEVAYQRKADVDLSYVRCLRILMAGPGYPMVATHDPRLVRIAQMLAERHGRSADSYEFQMLYGIRPDEQRRLLSLGHRMRVYVPYGDEWYGYLMRRLAERPANVAFFLRSVATRS
jgi:proline dehydrogenase